MRSAIAAIGLIRLSEDAIYSAFTETGATQTMKTNQIAEPKQ